MYNKSFSIPGNKVGNVPLCANTSVNWTKVRGDFTVPPVGVKIKREEQLER